jgi:hypothetical protein
LRSEITGADTETGGVVEVTGGGGVDVTGGGVTAGGGGVTAGGGVTTTTGGGGAAGAGHVSVTVGIDPPLQTAPTVCVPKSGQVSVVRVRACTVTSLVVPSTVSVTTLVRPKSVLYVNTMPVASHLTEPVLAEATPGSAAAVIATAATKVAARRVVNIRKFFPPDRPTGR